MRLSTFLPCSPTCAVLALAVAVAGFGFGFAQQNILDDPSRPPEERARDAGTKPVQLYAFWGIESGMTVADMMPGGGYNTYILTRLVGPSGKVYTGPDRRGGMAARLASNPLANTTLVASYDEMPAGSVDVIITVRNMHDLINGGNEAAALAQWMTALKPGGILGVVDARTSKPGFDADTHRINEQTVIDAVTAAGFELLESSDLLANPGDDIETRAETGNRYDIDRMTLKFRKPM
jgi:predicted methyltransferase